MASETVSAKVWGVGALLTCALLACVQSAAMAASSPVPAQRASVGVTGAQPQQGVDNPSITADGRIVAFTISDPQILGISYPPGPRVVCKDMFTGAVTLISAGESASGRAYIPDSGAEISGDGRFVYFPAVDSMGEGWCLFVRDRTAGTTRLAIAGIGGLPANAFFFDLRSSNDGRFVVFSSRATNVLVGVDQGREQVYRYDRVMNSLMLVSVNTGGTPGNGQSYGPSVSNDGSKVAFVSTSSDLVLTDTNANPDAFVREVAALRTTRVSVGPLGVESNGVVESCAMSRDGAYLAFLSNAGDLVAGVPPSTLANVGLFRRRWTTGEITAHVPIIGGATALIGMYQVQISDNGQRVAFMGEYIPSNLAGLASGAPAQFTSDEDPPAQTCDRGGPFSSADLFRYDFTSGALVRASSNSTGSAAFPYDYRMDGQGRLLAWESAEAAVLGDTNGSEDIFVSDPCGSPAVPSDPLPQRVALGEAAVFAVRAATGTFGRWTRDGQIIQDGGRFEGASTPILVIYPVEVSDQGQYRFVVLSPCGTEFPTSPAALSLEQRPCLGDADRNGVINFGDISTVLVNLQNVCP